VHRPCFAGLTNMCSETSQSTVMPMSWNLFQLVHHLSNIGRDGLCTCTGEHMHRHHACAKLKSMPVYQACFVAASLMPAGNLRHRLELHHVPLR
jgi:hypothetical protein